ncbi:hypothetical protein J3U30_06960 [Gilliamella sp. B3804]|nr:hypothetical protein [Gilliamella sp. B3801]MCX8592403.1 hypothetical protein [Gilliamella sp. B3804]
MAYRFEQVKQASNLKRRLLIFTQVEFLSVCLKNENNKLMNSD